MSATSDCRRLRVLLIDDDQVVVGSPRHSLAAQDGDLETATDPESALASADESLIVQTRSLEQRVPSSEFVGYTASRPPAFTTGSDSQPSFKGQHQ